MSTAPLSPPAQPGLDSLAKSFEPAAIEQRWGPFWEAQNFGHAGYRGTGVASADAALINTAMLPPIHIQLVKPNQHTHAKV